MNEERSGEEMEGCSRMVADADRAAAAIATLSELPLNELVYATLSLVNIPFPEPRLDLSAVAAAYAVEKSASYLSAAKDCEERRAAFEIGARKESERAEALRPTDPTGADEVTEDALYLSAEAEVEWHFFTICARSIQRMLALATRLVGATVDPADEQTLGSYGPLRNQFEHLDERLPGQDVRGRLILDDTEETRLLVGIRADDVGRITVSTAAGDVVCEVNRVGVWEIEQAVHATFREIDAKCIELLEAEFAAHPEKIPNADVIRPGLLARRKFVEHE